MVHTEPETIRQRILDTAQGLFFSQGVTVSTLEIASALGISKTTLYEHFPTKESLLLAIMDRVLDHWFGKIQALTGATDFAAALANGMVELSAFTRDISPSFQSNLRKYHPDVFASFIEKRDRAFDSAFDAIYKDATRAGHLRSGVSPALLKRYVLHSMDLLHDRDFVSGSGMKTEAILSGIIDILLYGVLKKP